MNLATIHDGIRGRVVVHTGKLTGILLRKLIKICNFKTYINVRINQIYSKNNKLFHNFLQQAK